MYKHEVKKCPRCGETFECKAGNIAQCQCAGVVLTAGQRAYIEQHYAGCLCAACLMHLSTEWNLFKEKYLPG